MTELKLWGRTLAEWSKDGFLKYNEDHVIANEGDKLKHVKKGGGKEDYKPKSYPNRARGHVRPATKYVVLHWTGMPWKFVQDKHWDIKANFTLDRDGTIYTAWHHDISSGHCSGSPKNDSGKSGDFFFSKYGAGIEIINVGHFRKKGSRLKDWAAPDYWVKSKKAEREGLYTPEKGAQHEKYFVRVEKNPWIGHADNPLTSEKHQPRGAYMSMFEDPAGDPDAQFAALNYLVKALCESYSVPKRLLKFPWMHGVGKGDADYEMLKWAYTGIIGHTNVQGNRADPGPCMDYYRLMRGITDLWYFPIDIDAQMDKTSGKVIGRDLSVTAPRKHTWDEALLTRFYMKCEEGNDGFFPVGRNNMWHNGIHVPVLPGQPVYCCAAGRIVAVRFGKDLDLYGGKTSARFVLVRHKVQYKLKKFFDKGTKYVRMTKRTPVYVKADGDAKVTALSPAPSGTVFEDGGKSGDRHKVKSLSGLEGFVAPGTFAEIGDEEKKRTWVTDYEQAAIDVYSLYMHLAAPADFKAANYGKEPAWLHRLKQEELDKLESGEVVLLDRPVFAGDHLGFAGKFDGRDLLHWEVFSPEEIKEGVWEDDRLAVKDGGDDVVCDFEKLKKFILDTTGDKEFSAVEIRNALARLRRVKAYHKSEWAAAKPGEYPEKVKERLELDGSALWNETKKLMFWDKITDDKAVGIKDAGGKAKKGVMWFYHPLKFMEFINARADRMVTTTVAGDDDAEPVKGATIIGAFWSTPAGERLEGSGLAPEAGTKVGLTVRVEGLAKGTEIEFYVMDRDWERDDWDEDDPEAWTGSWGPSEGDDFVQKVVKTVDAVDDATGMATVTAEWEIADTEWGRDELYFIARVDEEQAAYLPAFIDELEPNYLLSDNELLVPAAV